MIQGALPLSLDGICSLITSRWLEVWQPGSVAVIDESVYEYAGESPVHVFAPLTRPFA